MTPKNKANGQQICQQDQLQERTLTKTPLNKINHFRETRSHVCSQNIRQKQTEYVNWKTCICFRKCLIIGPCLIGHSIQSCVLLCLFENEKSADCRRPLDLWLCLSFLLACLLWRFWNRRNGGLVTFTPRKRSNWLPNRAHRFWKKFYVNWTLIQQANVWKFAFVIRS